MNEVFISACRSALARDCLCSPLREERDKGALGATRPTSDSINRSQASSYLSEFPT
jgi:hypothetical protein